MKYIVQAFKEKNIKQKDVISDLDIPQSYASALINGKKKIGKVIAEKLSTLYGFNKARLLLDDAGFIPTSRLEAKPLHLASDPNDYDNDGSRFEEQADGTLRMRVPIIPQKAYAGYLVGFQDPEYYEDLAVISIDVFKQHRGHYIAFEVNGDSMTTLDPKHFRESILDGWIAVGRELPRHQWRYKLHTHVYDA